MVGWRRWLNAHASEHIWETVEDRGAWCACCSLWGCKGHNLVTEKQRGFSYCWLSEDFSDMAEVTQLSCGAIRLETRSLERGLV